MHLFSLLFVSPAPAARDGGFYEDLTVSQETLLELVDLGRLSPTGGNKQPLKFIISWEKEKNELIYPTLAWAGYLTDWAGPEAGERPAAYIIILEDKDINMNVPKIDFGIAAQSIMLGAAEKGLGGCMIYMVQRQKLREVLHIPEKYEILMVLALGQPKEEVVVDEIENEADIKYWRDNNRVHHVPKRKLKDVVLEL
ncbi:nitroreductase family protein [Thermanaerosceptrum fracticalcis]|uniref:nitroreductase family protein n=1 Tax=Thermanaerosceptrum fracticalcis TaxID=1712410 RepID=UPI001FAC1C05|nr:nitroreductase family protein [Thermanaerosceptrum fracticalcis]